MRKLIVFGLLSFALAVSGCVQLQYSKSVNVRKDASGKILEIVETETVVQPGQGWPIEFEYIKGIQSRDSSK